MKNIHLIPTDKPTGIFESNSGLQFSIIKKVRYGEFKGYNLNITNNEEIKVNDYVLDDEQDVFQVLEINHTQGILRSDGFTYVIDICKKIILTTDQDLIADGVQAIDDEFLEWFVAHPSCESVKVELEVGSLRWLDSKNIYKIKRNNIMENNLDKVNLEITTKLEQQEREKYTKRYNNLNYVDFSNPNDDKIFSASTTTIKQETTLEEAELRQLFKNRSNCYADADYVIQAIDENCFIEILKEYQQNQDKKLYSEEEVIGMLIKHTEYFNGYGERMTLTKWFEQNKKK